MTDQQTIPVSDEERLQIQNVLREFGITRTAEIARNTIGFVNETFVINTGAQKYVLRRSNPATTTREHIEFEIEALRFLEESGFALTPRILPNVHNRYITEYENRLYVFQTFISGVVRASWNDTDTFDGMALENFFKASAQFTRAVEKFTPSKPYPNFPLTYYTENAARLLDESITSLFASEGKVLLEQVRVRLIEFAQYTQKEFERLRYAELPQQLVHFDMHPGNMHYEGSEVVGIFDLDWARLDSRIADTAGSIAQSCYIFGGEKSGLYLKDKVTQGMRVYREAYGPSECSPSEETDLIKAALRGYDFYLLIWVAEWYHRYREQENALMILRHTVNMCLLNNFDELFSGV